MTIEVMQSWVTIVHDDGRREHVDVAVPRAAAPPGPAATGTRRARVAPSRGTPTVISEVEHKHLTYGLARGLLNERHQRAERDRRERRELRNWDSARLAAEAGVSRRTVRGLIVGDRRLTDTMCWRLAAALRSDLNEQAVAALAARLIDLAGPSVRASRRPNRRRARLIAEARGGTPGGLSVADGDSLADVTVTALTTAWRTAVSAAR